VCSHDLPDSGAEEARGARSCDAATAELSSHSPVGGGMSCWTARSSCLREAQIVIENGRRPSTCSPQGNNRMSTIEDNKRIALRWFDLVTQGRVEELCAMTAPTWTMHGGPPSLPAGPEGIRALFASFGRIEQTWSIQDVIAEGDRVAVRAWNSCLQESFLGIPSYGRRQEFSATFIFRIVDGQVHEIWRNADDLGRVLQLGARIEPAGATP
jgi:predicted SnoaL-like aldol condensation-catalyzing enzyme